MEFDKSKVYTLLNADEVKIGSEGYFADNLECLKEIIELKRDDYYGKIDNIEVEIYSCRFHKKGKHCYGLFYLVKEPEEEKFRPYSNPEEMIEDFKKRYNAYGGWSGKDNPMYNPLIWIKSKTTGFRHLVTDYGCGDDGPCNKSCIWIGSFFLVFKKLFEEYTYLDGTPCGINEEEQNETSLWKL